MRVGIGYDVHRLVEGRELFLGGVEIPFEKGLLGHSDGDVLIHAVCDALLGAMAEGDIGMHFPDTDASIKDIDSAGILTFVAEMMKRKGFKVVNIDAVVVAEAPRIAPFRDRIRQRLAGLLSIDVSSVSVKGKTTEGLGFTGRGEGIEAQAVALIDRDEPRK